MIGIKGNGEQGKATVELNANKRTYVLNPRDSDRYSVCLGSDWVLDVTNGTLALGRARLLQVFRYIAALNTLQNPSVTRLDEHSPQWTLWLNQLPKHPDVALNLTIDELRDYSLRELGSEVTETENWIMRVRRPKLTAFPQPPTSVLL